MAYANVEAFGLQFADIEALEARVSSIGYDGIVTRAGRSSTSAADRDALVGWLRKHPSVQAVEAGEFVDGWYD